jgi:hypothetical protein
VSGSATASRSRRRQHRPPPDLLAVTNFPHSSASSQTRRRRLKAAALRHDACIEDADLRAPRGLDRALFQRLAAGEWIGRVKGC